MTDFKTIFLIPLIAMGIFAVLIFIQWINVVWSISIHLPFIQYIDPNTLSWIHFFEIDPTPFPYTYALAYYKPQLWWTMCIVETSIIAVAITIILLVMIS